MKKGPLPARCCSLFSKELGIKYLDIARDRALLKLSFKKELTNPHGGLHGGAIASLADTAAALSLSKRFDNCNFFTVSLKIRFKAQAKADIFALASVTSSRKNLYLIGVKIFDSKKTEVAQCHATFYVQKV